MFLLGESQQVEVTFRPDRFRYLPYREELQIRKTLTSYESILRINLVGRSIGNQLYVMPSKPSHELFAYHLNDNNHNNNVNNDNSNDNNNNINNKNDNFIGQGMLLFDDVIAFSTNEEIKKFHSESLKYSQTILPKYPSIKLEYPNPFSDDADPSLFTEIDRKILRQNSIKMSSGDNSNKAIQNLNLKNEKNELSRQQSQRVLISSISTLDNRGASSAPGSFEIILSSAAKESGLWTVNSVIVSSTGI